MGYYFKFRGMDSLYYQFISRLIGFSFCYGHSYLGITKSSQKFMIGLLKQNWFKTIFSIICWTLFLWGIFIVFMVLFYGSYELLKSWKFYGIGLMPLIAAVFIRVQIKKTMLQFVKSSSKIKSWLSENWFKVAIIILILLYIFK